ncbi:MAG: hypothetical protein JSS62_04055 [Verrucomicrobia bacterium]|nr:hypothetical protein [Verrucomicrobiota bacterium]MBS0647213.1 hypothetical protein [Verrucomicrobiota bacterium]
MSLKGTLTNEKLSKRFGSPFALVCHAIHVAKQSVQKGEGMEMHLASDILERIAKGEDILEPIAVEGHA